MRPHAGRALAAREALMLPPGVGCGSAGGSRGRKRGFISTACPPRSLLRMRPRAGRALAAREALTLPPGAGFGSAGGSGGREKGVHKPCLPSSAACLACGRMRGERWQPVKPSRCCQAPAAALPAAAVAGRGVHRPCLPSSAACLACGRMRGERWQPVKPSRCRQALCRRQRWQGEGFIALPALLRSLPRMRPHAGRTLAAREALTLPPGALPTAAMAGRGGS